MAGQIGLAKCGVNFLVTNMVEQNRLARFTTFKFWHQMMPRLWCIRRNGSVAKGACLGPVTGHAWRLIAAPGDGRHSESQYKQPPYHAAWWLHNPPSFARRHTTKTHPSWLAGCRRQALPIPIHWHPSHKGRLPLVWCCLPVHDRYHAIIVSYSRVC